MIMVKSCYPASNIGDDAQLEADKGYYRTIAARMDQYPNKLLIIVSNPPQVPGATNAAEASRARALNNWLLSGEFQNGHANVKVFDLFGCVTMFEKDTPKGFALESHEVYLFGRCESCSTA